MGNKIRASILMVLAAIVFVAIHFDMILLSHFASFWFGSISTIILIKEKENVTLWLNSKGVMYGIEHKETGRNEKLGKTSKPKRKVLSSRGK